MAEWVLFLHAPRERFTETMSDEEHRIMGAHFERLRRMRVCVLAWRRRLPVFRVQRHEKTH